MINETGERLLMECSLEANSTCWNSEVHRLNKEFSDLMSPVVTLMVTLMAIGLTGNTLVLWVYGHRENRTTAQIFIMYLACTDLLACTMIHPYVIYKLFQNYNQTWVVVCKLFEFTIHSGLTISGVALLAIAADRYLAICRPIKFVDFHKHIYKIILGTIAFGTLGSTPIIVFYGPRSEKIRHKDHIFIGYKCDYMEEYTGSALLGYSIFVVTCFMSVIIGIIVLYKKVAVVAFRSRRRVKPVTVELRDIIPMKDAGTYLSKTSIIFGTGLSQLSTTESRSTKLSCVDDISTKMSSQANGSPNLANPGTSSSKEVMLFDVTRALTFPKSFSLSGVSKPDLSATIKSDPVRESVSSVASVHSTATEGNKLSVPNRFIADSNTSPRRVTSARQTMSLSLNTSDNSGRNQRLDRTKNLSSGLKAAKILFLVTAVFLLSWLPFFTIRVLYIVGLLSPIDISPRRQVLEHFLNHCFYINNAANPLIYSMINQNFRKECWKRLKRMCGVNNTININ